MRLIGQYDSPFVRRVAVALVWYGVPFEHWPWSVWADAERLAEYNPLRRVPTLVLEDGTALVESSAILEFLDERAVSEGGSVAERLLLPRSGPERLEGFRLTALATGAAEKAVSLFYEHRLREAPLPLWADRCRAQITDTLERIEASCRARGGDPYYLGPKLSHADVAVTCMWRFLRDAHPSSALAGRFPRLEGLASRCEALEVFQAIQQPLIVTV
jgi:glutathione S-transferase